MKTLIIIILYELVIKAMEIGECEESWCITEYPFYSELKNTCYTQ